mmetsp:Transcript_13445/g.29468  ORF Transcript_13445/g.29468 Transcript_13445/m.29468 type:complete len:234 (+) Transcript_13445:117-818(+)
MLLWIPSAHYRNSPRGVDGGAIACALESARPRCDVLLALESFLCGIEKLVLESERPGIATLVLESPRVLSWRPRYGANGVANWDCEVVVPRRRTPITELRTKVESLPSCTWTVKICSPSLLCAIREAEPTYWSPSPPFSIRVPEEASRKTVMRVAEPRTYENSPGLVAWMYPKLLLKRSTTWTGGSSPGVKTTLPMSFNIPPGATKERPTLLCPAECFTVAVSEVSPESRKIA